MRTVKLRNLARLTNGKLLSFAKLVRTEGEASGDERLTSLINKLDTKTDAMRIAMMYSNTGAQTMRIRTLSESINQSFRVLRKLSSVLPYSTVEAFAKTGELLHAAFEKYGDISQMTYEDKAAKLSLLLKELEGIALTTIQALGFQEMFSSLEADHEEFDQLYLERNSYRDTIKAKVATARAEVESVLTQIINYSVVMSYFDENFDRYVGDMNEFFVWNIKSVKSESEDTESDDSAAGSQESSDNEASKGELSDESMEA